MKKILLAALLVAVAFIASAQTWTDTFQIYVTKVALPDTLDSSLAIETVAGSTDTSSGTITLTNGGNVAIGFDISTDPALERLFAGYDITQEQHILDWQRFYTFDVPDTNEHFETWIDATTAEEEIGFEFPFFFDEDTTYNTFAAGQHGALVLGNGALATNTHGVFEYNRGFFDFPVPLSITNVDGSIDPPDPADSFLQVIGDYLVDTDPLIAPFWSNLLIPTNNVRLRKQPERLTVSWEGAAHNVINGTDGLQFQTQLMADGTIKILYKDLNNTVVSNAVTGIQIDAPNNPQNDPAADTYYHEIPLLDEMPMLEAPYTVTYTPTFKDWITISQTGGSIGTLGTQEITVTVDPLLQDPDTTYEYDLMMIWANGETNNVKLSITNHPPPATAISVPSEVNFSGKENAVTTTNIIFANIGNSQVNYRITDMAATNEYTWDQGDYAWFEPTSDAWVFEPSDLDEGYTDLRPIGFEFPYHGGIYTNFSLGVNGGIVLGESAPIYTFQSWFYYDYRLNRAYRRWTARLTDTIDGNEVDIYVGAFNPYYSNTLTTTTHTFPPLYIRNNFSSYTEQYDTIGSPVRPQFIAPFWADMRIGSDSKISVERTDTTVIITWENMVQKPKLDLMRFEWNDTIQQMPVPGQSRESIASGQTFQAILNQDGTIVFQYKTLNNPEAWREDGIVGLRDTATRVTEADLLASTNIYQVNLPDDSWDGTLPGLTPYLSDSARDDVGALIQVTYPTEYILINEDISVPADTTDTATDTNGVILATGELNWQEDLIIEGHPVVRVETNAPVEPFTDEDGHGFLKPGLPKDTYNMRSTTITQLIPIVSIVSGDLALRERALRFTPNDPGTRISISPRTGSLMPNETNDMITISGDASGANVSTNFNNLFIVEFEGGSQSVDVTFEVIAMPAPDTRVDSDGDGLTDFAEYVAGTDALDPGSTYTTHVDGSRTITWTGASENTDMDRTYIIEYTTDLTQDWSVLAVVTDGTSFADTINVDEPVVYYRVVVEVSDDL